MRSFKEYLLEDTFPIAESKGQIDVSDDSVRDRINLLLTKATSGSFSNPHTALQEVMKVLAQYHIFLPKFNFLEDDHGVEVWQLKQFGDMMGAKNNGEIVTKENYPYSIFFEYQRNEIGLYVVFCEVVDQDELEELLDDVEKEYDRESD